MALTDTGSARVSFLRGTGAPPATPAWLDLPFTSESLSEKLSSTQSSVMRADRQFAGSRVIRAESGGDVGLEMAYGLWFDELLSGVVQSTAVFPPAPLAGAIDSIVNDKVKAFFAFEKRLEASTGFQYMTFNDCQINTLSLDIKANALATMTVGVVGLNSSNATAEAAGATYAAFNINDQMDSNSAVLEFKDSANVVLPVIANSLSFNIDNQMRGQQAIGSLYNAGNASGRLKVTMSASIYFRDQTLYTKFMANSGIKVFITLSDTAGNTYKFGMENVKVTSYDVSAGGADQDMVVPIEFQAFPAVAAANKTITITRTTI